MIGGAVLRFMAPALALLLAISVSFSSRAQAPDNIKFTYADSFMLTVDGQPIQSDMFQSIEGTASILITSVDLDAPLLIDLDNQRVKQADEAMLSGTAKTGLILLRGSTLADYGAYDSSPTELNFQVDGKNMALGQRAYLLGLQSAKDLKTYSLRYVHGAENFEPDSRTIQLLIQQQVPVRVRIYFGSWCPHCQKHVPALVRLADELKASAVKFEFYGLPPGFGEEPEAKANNIDVVPTGVVSVNNQEKGRMSDGWEHPEQVLLGILDGSS